MNDSVRRFLDLFVEAEKLVADSAGQKYEGHTQFRSNLRDAAARDRRVRRFEKLLIVSAALRNALVHERYNAERIAVPNPDLVDDLGQAVEWLRNPPTVLAKFKRELREFRPEESIGDVLAFTSAHNFSQVVVRNQGQLDLLSSNTIHRWLANYAKLGLVELDASVADVMRFKEPKYRELRLAPRQTTVFEALDLFQQGQEGHLLALIITERGKATEKPLAFLTPWDLGELSSIADAPK